MDNISVFATATITNKRENQDSKGIISKEMFNAVLVADGLGSYKYAQKASNSVIESFLKELKNLEDISSLDFESVFKIAKEELVKLSKIMTTKDESETDNLFGTTAIALVETKKSIKIGYVGNGAIWHIRGNFNEFPAVYSFPWNAVNFLNPHSISENGKEALYRLISDYKDDYRESVPSVIEIKKDLQQGDILMICTDGIFSEDQRKMFNHKEKGALVQYEKTMKKFFDYLKQFFEQNCEYTNENLETALNSYLSEMKPSLDDDATLGVLITQCALDYQNKKNK